MNAYVTNDSARSKSLKPVEFDQLIDDSISKPARYMGHELGVEKHEWESGKVLWTLSYPELYEIGSSNLGHIILYSILNKIPGQICDRAYLPAPDFARKLREMSQPLFAVESRRPLIAFDILGFSLSYELGATNILEMLDLAGLNIYSSARGDLPLNDPNSPPLIFAGGPTATSNPEPFAAFFDFFALGDGEELLPEIGLVLAEGKTAGLNRSSLLKDLSYIPGIYVPSLYNLQADQITIGPKNSTLPKRLIRRVATPMPHYGMGLVPNIETVHDRLTVEIRRGCTRGCRFCQPGMITRPARDVNPEAVIEAVETGMKKTGYSDFSLLSLSCSDYLALPAIGIELKNRLSDKNITLQLPSQRIDRFSDEIAHILGGTRQAGLTFAPEAGTQKLRDIVNKDLTDEDLIKGIRKAMEHGYRRIKLYFMIGLPGETDADVLGIANTCQMLQEKCLDLGKLFLNLTISNFTPKPHTPFQWHSVSSNEFERRQKILKESFRSLKGIKANFTDTRISAIEDFIGRGDRKVSEVIANAWHLGAGMDAWFEKTDKTHQAWEKAISLAGLKKQYRKLEIGNWHSIETLSTEELMKFCSKPLPWDHIDSGVEKSWLAEDLRKALNQNIVPDCSFNGCSKCGVCGPELGHNVIEKAPLIPTRKAYQAPKSNKACRIRLKFSKTIPISLLGHLDVMRLLERSLRRSNLPISFTAGFHPLPRIQIALALPLGVEALGEWMDLEFTQIVEANSVLLCLQKELPDGIKLLTAHEVPVNDVSLAKQLNSAVWSFDLSVQSPPNLINNKWEEVINTLIDSPQLIWEDTDKKGRTRRRDFKSQMKSLSLKQPKSENKDLLPSGTAHAHLELETTIDSMGRSIKPLQVRSWISEELCKPLRISNVKRNELKLLEC